MVIIIHKMTDMKGILSYLLLTAASLYAFGQNDSDTTSSGSLLRSYWHSLIYGNVDRSYERDFDITFGIALTYTQEGGIGLGGTLTGIYRLDKTDSLMMPSNIILNASASIKGFYVIEANGSNYFRKGRLVYNFRFSRKNLDFWGIRFNECSANPKGGYTRMQFRTDIDYIYGPGRSFSIGTGIRINYARASAVTPATYLDGQSGKSFLAGINASLLYDTRDSHTNPSEGIYILLRGTLWPEFLSDREDTFVSGGITASAYHTIWKGGVIAGDIYLYMNEKDCPWNLREEISGYPGRMRGYYVGRYIDSCQLCAQMELRQRIYRRIGAVAWAGIGTLFPTVSGLKWAHMLPNWGTGLRFEYKKDINLRADIGFGRKVWGLSFGFSEAF